jgi:exodeoxyribonuclease V gamma subunit
VDEDGPILLGELVRFLEHPTAHFLSTRAGVSVPKLGDLSDDNLPIDLDALEKWGVAHRLLTGLLSGHAIDQLSRHERLTDALPAGRLGDDDLATATDTATALADAARSRGYDPTALAPVTGLVAAGGRDVEGSVLADHARGHLITVTASALKGKHRIRAYAELMFATAAAPETAWKALLLGKVNSKGGPWLVTLEEVPGADPADRRSAALERLGVLVELYTEGHRHPLPLPCETGYTWQRNVAGEETKAAKEARAAFEGKYPELDGPHLLAAPNWATFDSLRAAGFEEYCRMLWIPILRQSVEGRP